MKIIFVLILVIHGFIHLLGFLKAFNLATIEQLTVDIPKPLGLVWLLSTILMLLISILVILNKNWVWIPAIIAIILSQMLIIFSWQDAKFGTIPNILILIFAIFSFATWNFNVQIEKETNNLLSQVKGPENPLINEPMLGSLPSPVQRWLNHAGIVGKEPIQTVYLKQRGQMKLKPNQETWYSAEVDQYVTTNQPGFLWKVNMKMSPFFNVVGRDKFQAGKAAMMIKVGSLFSVVNTSNNQKINQSTLSRYLMEIIWYPSVALSPYITWEEIDQHTAKATMTYKGVTGIAVFYFDDSGNPIKVSTMRYNDSGVLAECIGEVNEYGTFDGIKIPTKVNITWVLDEGLFTWYKLEVLNVKYN